MRRIVIGSYIFNGQPLIQIPNKEKERKKEERRKVE